MAVAAERPRGDEESDRDRDATSRNSEDDEYKPARCPGHGDILTDRRDQARTGCLAAVPRISESLEFSDRSDIASHRKPRSNVVNLEARRAKSFYDAASFPTGHLDHSDLRVRPAVTICEHEATVQPGWPQTAGHDSDPLIGVDETPAVLDIKERVHTAPRFKDNTTRLDGEGSEEPRHAYGGGHIRQYENRAAARRRRVRIHLPMMADRFTRDRHL